MPICRCSFRYETYGHIVLTNDGIGEAHRGSVGEPDAGPLVGAVGGDGEVHLVRVLVVLPPGHIVAGLGLGAAAPRVLPLTAAVVQPCKWLFVSPKLISPILLFKMQEIYLSKIKLANQVGNTTS